MLKIGIIGTDGGIDKPFTCTVEDAETLIREARKPEQPPEELLLSVKIACAVCRALETGNDIKSVDEKIDYCIYKSITTCGSIGKRRKSASWFRKTSQIFAGRIINAGQKYVKVKINVLKHLL